MNGSRRDRVVSECLAKTGSVEEDHPSGSEIA
jgi:hypothetical protein